MTNQEAIQVLENNYPDSHFSRLREAVNVALQALEKQIPKKPIEQCCYSVLCSSCGDELIVDVGNGYYDNWYYKEVCDCGQRIEWESEGDN